MLARRGLITPPWGTPPRVSCRCPSIRTPARNHWSISFSTRRSLIRRRTRPRKISWSTLLKKPSMSASTTHQLRTSASLTASTAPAYTVVSTDPHMLRLDVLEPLEQVAPTSDAAIGRRRAAGPEAEQCLKSRHRLVSPIVPEDELVQVRLQLCAADAVIGADQPVLEIPDRAVRERHHGGGALAQGGTRRLLEGDVPVPCGLHARESCKAVGVDRRAGRDVRFENGGHGRRREVREHHHPDATRMGVPLLHGHQDGDRTTVLQLAAPL